MDATVEKPENPNKGDRWFDEQSGYLMEYDGYDWKIVQAEAMDPNASFPCPACGSPLDSDGLCTNLACESRK